MWWFSVWNDWMLFNMEDFLFFSFLFVRRIVLTLTPSIKWLIFNPFTPNPSFHSHTQVIRCDWLDNGRLSILPGKNAILMVSQQPSQVLWHMTNGQKQRIQTEKWLYFESKFEEANYYVNPNPLSAWETVENYKVIIIWDIPLFIPYSHSKWLGLFLSNYRVQQFIIQVCVYLRNPCNACNFRNHFIAPLQPYP